MTLMARFKHSVRDALPRPALLKLKQMAHAGGEVVCVVCGALVRALASQGHAHAVLQELDVVGGLPKAHDECLMCHANDRVRLVYLYVSAHTNLFSAPNRLLHLAPELGLADHFSKAPLVDYVPADLDRRRYRHLRNLASFDLQSAPFADQSFDWIICNHVLEHIPNDRLAMRELHRMLKPGGSAILQVPMSAKLDVTREDPSIDDPSERIRLFGQCDHVRIYGRDYYDRLAAAGFEVTLWNAFAADPERAAAWNLNPHERLTVACRL